MSQKYSAIAQLKNFKIHAQGHCVMISGTTPKNNKYTFMATTSVLKYILCDLNQKVVLGSLSRCQMGGIFKALESIGCNYELIYFNDSIYIVSKNKDSVLQRKRINEKK